MEEEDKVVTLLASVPDLFDILKTALEAHIDVPSMEAVTERLLHERKLSERETASSERVMLKENAKKTNFNGP